MLQNNSSQMNTVVETFIIEETAELIYDNEKLEQWNNLVSELGLEGQKTIVKKDKSPIPFMHLKSGLVETFKTLCPSKVDVKNYNLTPIPVEILDLVALSIKEDYFAKIEIWYDEKDPDPVCIGSSPDWFIDDEKGSKLKNVLPFKSKKDAQDYIDLNGLVNHKPYQYATQAMLYLIGKWGDVKRSFEDLKKMAANRYFIEQTNSYRQTIKTYQGYLDNLKEETFRKFGNDNVSSEMDLPF